MAIKKTILHLHGFASSGHSAKALYLKERLGGIPGVEFLVPDFNPTPRDFEFMTVTGMINRLRQYILDRNLNNISISASSLGCLLALHYARIFGEVKKLLLLAPVLSYSALPFPEELFVQWEKEGSIKVPHFGFKEDLPLRYDFHRDGLAYSERVSPPAPVRILHGKNDVTISIQNSRDYAADYPDQVTLVEFDSDHALLDCLDAIGGHAASFLVS
ncbi:MAG: YqiA/YcfP family alpha/beta fold hydrolase [Thermodesulfovibrionales bacterium]